MDDCAQYGKLITINIHHTFKSSFFISFSKIHRFKRFALSSKSQTYDYKSQKWYFYKIINDYAVSTGPARGTKCHQIWNYRKNNLKKYNSYQTELSWKWPWKLKTPSCTELPWDLSRVFLFKGFFVFAMIPHLLVKLVTVDKWPSDLLAKTRGCSFTESNTFDEQLSCAGGRDILVRLVCASARRVHARIEKRKRK